MEGNQSKEGKHLSQRQAIQFNGTLSSSFSFIYKKKIKFTSPALHLPLASQIWFPWQSWSLVHPEKQGSTKTVVICMFISLCLHLPFLQNLFLWTKQSPLFWQRKHLRSLTLQFGSPWEQPPSSLQPKKLLVTFGYLWLPFATFLFLLLNFLTFLYLSLPVFGCKSSPSYCMMLARQLVG